MTWLATLSAVVVMAISSTFGYFFGSNHNEVQLLAEKTQTSSATTTEKVTSSSPLIIIATSSLASVPKGWATFTNELGFSIHYPYKETGMIYGDDGYFQIIFFMPASIVSADASTAENISQDIHNLDLYGPLSISVIKDNSSVTDIKSWAKLYLKKYDAEQGNHEMVLSEVVTPIVFAGVDGFQFVRSTEGEKSQNNPHYTRNEIFIYKNGLVYHIRSLAPSSDTIFPRSGTVGKKYLQRADEISKEVLKTFAFDDSKVTKIIVPKVQPLALVGEALARREKLLADLRARPYYDMNTWYPKPSDSCEEATPTDNATRNSISKHNMYVSADDSISDLHVYDANGNHAGPMPLVPGFPSSQIEERVSGVSSFDSGSSGNGFVFENLMDGWIELVGKENGSVNLSFRGDGNACSIDEVSLLVTKYSVAKILMTNAGGLGPISYDIDGDGVQDIEISLIHPLFPEKQRQLEAVFTDIIGMQIVH